MPFGHLIATPFSSSLDHILDPHPFTLPHPSMQSRDKKVGRSPIVSQSAKDSKQTDARYLKDLIHRG